MPALFQHTACPILLRFALLSTIVVVASSFDDEQHSSWWTGCDALRQQAGQSVASDSVRWEGVDDQQSHCRLTFYHEAPSNGLGERERENTHEGFCSRSSQ